MSDSFAERLDTQRREAVTEAEAALTAHGFQRNGDGARETSDSSSPWSQMRFAPVRTSALSKQTDNGNDALPRESK